MASAKETDRRKTPGDITARQAWILAARPQTLPAAFAPVIVGTAQAVADHVFAFRPALAALGVCLLLQIGVNLANDYFDHIKGIDTAERQGPIRVTHSGLIAPARVRSAMMLVFIAAAVIGAFLITIGGVPVILIGCACILAALAYSGGPFPLASHGLGDLFAFLFFGWVAVCGTYYLQALTITGASLLAASLVGFLITAILVINNLRDIETDRRTGKITMAVRLGIRGSKIEYGLLLAAAYFPLPLVWLAGRQSAWMMLPLVSLPPAIRLANNVRLSGGGPGLNQLLAATAKLALMYSCLLAVGIILNR